MKFQPNQPLDYDLGYYFDVKMNDNGAYEQLWIRTHTHVLAIDSEHDGTDHNDAHIAIAAYKIAVTDTGAHNLVGIQFLLDDCQPAVLEPSSVTPVSDDGFPQSL